jgi:hypothetical protein
MCRHDHYSPPLDALVVREQSKLSRVLCHKEVWETSQKVVATSQFGLVHPMDFRYFLRGWGRMSVRSPFAKNPLQLGTPSGLRGPDMPYDIDLYAEFFHHLSADRSFVVFVPFDATTREAEQSRGSHQRGTSDYQES